MKNYFKDFAVEDNSLVESCEELQGVIVNRHDKCARTVEYKEVHDEVYGFMKELETLSPEARKIILKLEASFTALEGICYSAAYRDGMSDLVGAHFN